MAFKDDEAPRLLDIQVREDDVPELLDAAMESVSLAKVPITIVTGLVANLGHVHDLDAQSV
jgi:hypothetical protein